MTVKRWAVAGAVAGLLLFGSVLTTGALFNDSVSLDGGAVHSGRLTLQTGNVGAQFSSYAFNELAGSNLKPGSSKQAPLTIKNGGNVSLQYRLKQTTATDATGLPASLSLTVEQVASEASCPTGSAGASGRTTLLYSGALVGAQTVALRPVTATATETLCLRVSLPSSAPNGAQDNATRVTFTFYAEST